ncbi:radical SAM protein, TatD family-associated [Halobacteroides halobius DSM 5150]|uniref:Radical SAM protein, TatD family-associated n=1 Tax=Halobacteroides halobius (strain ATCC 35273 / DSM 5150 / MD-1) TaxID=748449 RepID=L0K6D2_HALHC|nr:TatD family nuclease-associated radical SAM protein [Halobacteroides halobius]AGB40095.1 radical SAM protein, TatD family-associated [Halobacteroides halobius DSM 5150]
MTITYQLGDKLYINLTNRCSNDCKFCVRNFKDGVGGYDLWLEEEPSVTEVIAEFDDVSKYGEVVFCGYGEPLTRVAAVVEISQYLQDNYPDTLVRVNTNGQANLIHRGNILPRLQGKIDIISISLNASNATKYQEICQSDFGVESFTAVVDFIKQAKKVIPKVIVSVVSSSNIDLEACRDLASQLEVEFRIR